MSSVNKATLIGRVGADPEIRRLQDGSPVVNIRLATSETWKDKHTGERKEKTEWHTVVIFNEGIAKVAESYVRKGSKIYVEGAIQSREWQDKDGVKRYSTEIVLQKFRGELTLLDSPKRDDNAPSSDDYRAASGGSISQRAKVAAGGGWNDDLGDDIPF